MILRGDFNSEALRLNTNIQVMVPDNASGPYRIVYLLHGMHGNQGTWLDYTMLPYYGKKYNAIFVMPEAGRSFYFNQKYGRKYYTYVSDELPRVCKNLFNISSRREDTAAIGCSMGGFGALMLALTRPDQYGFCGAISPACLYYKPILDSLREDTGPFLKTGAEAEEILNDLYSIYGEGLEYHPDYDVSEMAKNFPAAKPRPRIYATCGTEDDLRKDNLQFRDQMKNSGHDFTYEEWAGGHDWYFFNDALKKSLDFWLKSENTSNERGGA